MRVLESKPGGATILLKMGKKKHKLRKQSKENEQCNSDSSDEGGASAVRGCPHVSKAISFNNVKKFLKAGSIIGECTACSGDKKCESSVDQTPVEIEDGLEAPEPTIWLCLQCGHQGCDRNSREKHSLKHYQTPRSNSHAIVLNVTTWTLWCYDCDDEVMPETCRKLQECIEFVRKQAGLAPRQDSAASFGGKKGSNPASPVPESIDAQSEKSKINRPKSASNQQAAMGITQALAKVKGLQNLGNTCFFNAVMQNLAQTHVLEAVLCEHVKKGVLLPLPGCTPYYDTDDSDGSVSDEDDDKPSKLALGTMCLNLGDSGALTQSVSTFLKDMNSPSKNNSISPSSLFGQVCRKAPRFKGYQQQDSHELLRHLLDGMKAEEIKRSQMALLKAFHLPENVNPKKVDEDTKAKLKEYGRQAKNTVVDSIFGGHFISTVLCEECKTPSQIFEPFLDISLPITEEKTVRPNSIWGARKQKSLEEAPAQLSHLLPLDKDKDSKPSKHMSKKAKRQAKTSGKRKVKQKGQAALENDIIENEEEEEEDGVGEDKSKEEIKVEDHKEGDNSDNSTRANVDSRSLTEDDISDADIEDNLESDVSATRLPTLDMNGAAMEGVEEAQEALSPSLPNPPTSEHPLVTPGTPTPSNVAVDMEKLNINGSIVNGFDDDKDEDSDETDTTSDTSPSCKSPKTVVRSKSDLRLEARHRAMATLAPRFQPVSHECSVMSCLNQFTAAELLTGNNKFRCSVCTRKKYVNQGKQGKKEPVYTNACKQLLIFRPPAVLTLHMKRFQQVGFSLRKVNRHVEFPMVLDIAPFCSALCQDVVTGDTRVVYSLYGVVEHSGRLTGGHYTAYVKSRPSSSRSKEFINCLDTATLPLEQLLEKIEGAGAGAEGSGDSTACPPPGKWYYISDSRVSEVTNESNVLRCQAYMLFYERIH